MKTLMIDHDNSELRYEARHLLVYSEGKRINNIPLSQIDRLIVAPHVVITAGVLGVIAEQGLSLLVVNFRFPSRTAILSGNNHGDICRRLKQYRLSLDDDFCVRFARTLVTIKIKHQQQLLKKALKKRQELRLPLTKCVGQIDGLLCSLRNNHVGDLQVLCGLEGAAAAMYFEAYHQLFPSEFAFSVRKRRPPPDPVNALLSLCYTLIHHEAVVAIKMNGLDPMLGFYHQPYYGRDSLACDLVEPLRTYVDEWVWRWVAEKKLTLTHFCYQDGGCFLNAAGKKLFYRLFFSQVKPLKRLLRYYARNVVKALEEVE